LSGQKVGAKVSSKMDKGGTLDGDAREEANSAAWKHGSSHRGT
jgi:hypothetical protein